MHGARATRRTALHETERILPFAYLLTALLFARSGLYAERGAAPGAVADRRLAVPGGVRRAALRGRQRRTLLQLLPLLRLARLRAASTSPSLRAVYERLTGALLRAAGYRRRAVLVGTGKHIGDVAHALGDAPHSPIEVVGFLSPTRAAGQRPALARLARATSSSVLDSERIDEVIIADPDFPQDDAVELVDQCHRRGVRVRLAPSTMEILIHRAEFVPGQSVPLFELGPPVFEGVDFALKRTFDLVGATLLLVLLSPLLLAIALAVRADLARAGRCTARCAAASASGRSPA